MSLDIIFLQNGESDGWIGITIAVISVAAVTASSLMQWRSYKMDEAARGMNIISDLSKQISNTRKGEHHLNSKSDCDAYAVNYLDLMERTAFLFRNGEINKKFSRYFDNDFSYALTIIQWMATHQNWSSNVASDNFPDLVKWCTENEIGPFIDNLLPPDMQEYANLPDGLYKK